MIASFRKTFARLMGDKKGVTALEYAVLAATTVVALAAAMVPVAGALNTLFGSIVSAL